jgi:hypothetical protein
MSAPWLHDSSSTAARMAVTMSGMKSESRPVPVSPALRRSEYSFGRPRQSGCSRFIRPLSIVRFLTFRATVLVAPHWEPGGLEGNLARRQHQSGHDLAMCGAA